MIRLDSISKIYKVGGEDFYALRDVSLSVERGEFVAVMGASGSGKTTLLNIIGCLDSFDGGSYLLEGQSVGGLSDERKARIRNEKIGFVLQDFALINQQTVLYNVMLPLLFGKTPYRQISYKAKLALEKVGVLSQADKKANQLSGGQRQRVAIARALVVSPSVILADEPTGQLDSKTGIQIMQLLKGLNEEGMTVMAVTHDSAVAEYASRRLIMEDGRIK